MFKSLRDMFRIKDIRKKLFYTFMMLILIRFGSQLPVPGVDRTYFSRWFSQQNNGAFTSVHSQAVHLNGCLCLR